MGLRMTLVSLQDSLYLVVDVVKDVSWGQCIETPRRQFRVLRICVIKSAVIEGDQFFIAGNELWKERDSDIDRRAACKQPIL